MIRPLHLSTLLLALASVAFVAPQDAAGEDETSPPALKVVELVISGNAAEDPRPDNPLGPTQRNFRGRLQQIRAIAADPEIAGVKLDIEGSPSFAHSLDLLDEMEALRAAGKRIVCYTETLTQRDAAFATFADYLAVPPSGMIIFEGLIAESMYLKDLFEHVDVSFEVLHVGDYKTAYENLAKNEMSAENREVIGLLLDEFYGQLLETIAANRGMTTQDVETVFGRIFVDPEEAAEMGLVDAAVYEEEFDAHLEQVFGGEIEIVKGYGDRTKEDVEKMLADPFAMFRLLPMLLAPPQKEAPDEPHVAVVFASGQIVSGKSQVDFQGTVTAMGSETIVKALRQAGEDENCKAVVFRVNSPGGSALASDMIWRAVEEVQKTKPVISSMGSMAASGGYWISMGCDVIVAQPSTLTGSIGVVSMLPDVSDMLENLGVNVEVVARGPHGDQLALLKNGPTDVLKDAMYGWMEHTYDEFVTKVSAGRGLDRETVYGLAKGRVWTGRQAEEVGLVDVLGGLEDSVELACVMVGLDPSSTPLAEYPQAPNFLDQIEEAMEGMATVQTPVERLLRARGFGDLLDIVTRLLEQPRGLHADLVQALMPLQIVIR